MSAIGWMGWFLATPIILFFAAAFTVNLVLEVAMRRLHYREKRIMRRCLRGVEEARRGDDALLLSCEEELASVVKQQEWFDSLRAKYGDRR